MCRTECPGPDHRTPSIVNPDASIVIGSEVRAISDALAAIAAAPISSGFSPRAVSCVHARSEDAISGASDTTRLAPPPRVPAMVGLVSRVGTVR